MRLLLLFLSTSLFATDVTVCASGCTYSNLQTALTATASNCAIDSITVTAGETFAGTYNTPYRDCAGSVWLRSSRYSQLPPVGTRVGPEHASLMPTINANVVNSPGLYFYDIGENNMSGVDLGTETMTIASAIPNNVAFSCSNTPPPPMVQGTIYYSIYVDAIHMKAALTYADAVAGTAINITGAGSTGDGYYQQPHCIAVKPRKNWRVTGFNITMPSGTTMQNALVVIGGLESNALSVPNNIWLDRNYIHGHGDMSADYPNGGVYFHGSNLNISDNYISDVRCFSCEGKPLAGWNIPGPVLIQNNAIMGGSIGILIGGAKPSIPENQSTNVTIRKNYWSQPGKNMYRQGAGAPSGSCYYGAGSGMFYRNTSSSGTTCSLSGRCYTCQSNNTWAVDTTASYRADDFLLKNPIELKEANGVTIEDNIWEGQQGTIDTQGNCFLLVIGATTYTNYARDVTYRNNKCTDTWGGPSLSSYSNMTAQSRNISLENNLITGMGSPRLLNVFGATDDTIWQIRMPKWQSLSYRHNTMRPDGTPTITRGYGIYSESNTVGMAAYSLPAYLENNIWWYGDRGSSAEGGTGCASTSTAWGAQFLNDGSKQVSSNVQFGNAAGLGGLNSCATSQNLAAVALEATVDFETDSSLKATSPYSASNGGATFVATDGSDVGVDLVRLNTAINGVTTGVPGIQIKIEPGSVRTIAKYEAPDSSACTIKLYNNLSRQTLNADTDSGGEQTDSRTGSVTQGRSRQVVLGVNSALTASTQYWFTVACGSTTLLSSFKTLSAGSGTYNVTTLLPSANTGEYSSSADMSSPTAISSSTTQVVPVPTGTVRYYRQTGGLIQALIAR